MTAKLTPIFTVPPGTPTKEVLIALAQTLENYKSWVFGNTKHAEAKREAYQEVIDMLGAVVFDPPPHTITRK